MEPMDTGALDCSRVLEELAGETFCTFSLLKGMATMRNIYNAGASISPEEGCIVEAAVDEEDSLLNNVHLK
eukprot:8073149-Karenia_brevis.AAC.1